MTDEYRHLRGTLSKIEAKVVPGHELAKLTEKQLQMAPCTGMWSLQGPGQQYKLSGAQNLGTAWLRVVVSRRARLKAADTECAMGIAGTDTAKKLMLSS